MTVIIYTHIHMYIYIYIYIYIIYLFTSYRSYAKNGSPAIGERQKSGEYI